MSHFTVMVIGAEPEKQLAPFDENIEMPKYDTGEVSKEDIDSMIQYYKKEKKHIVSASFDELYKNFGSDWNSNRWTKHADGTWHEYSTYNPNSKWDWYALGGRWAGSIELKDGAKKLSDPNFSWGWDAKDKATVKENQTDSALKKDIANIDTLSTFAVVKDGKWYERGEMGWWGCVSNEKDGKEWGEQIKKLLSDLPDDTLISIYDCHI